MVVPRNSQPVNNAVMSLEPARSRSASVSSIEALIDETAISSFALKAATYDALRDDLQRAEHVDHLQDPLHVTADQLSIWKRAADDLKARVSAFDTGDLSHMRKLARFGRSMSTRDADLVEVVLKTLTSLDRLTYLLRQRTKMLDLVGLRMKWEQQLDATEKELLIVQEGVASLLRKARWSRPVPQSSSDIDEVIRSGRAAAKAHGEKLALDVVRQNARMHRLTSETLVKAGRTLDILIDDSPTPLPDGFLARQEAVEQEVKSSTTGLGSFASALLQQYKQADAAFWSLHEIELRADVLQEEVETTLAQRLSLDSLSIFKERLQGLQDTFDGIRWTLPKPEHQLCADQPNATDQVDVTLSAESASVNTLLQRIREILRRGEAAATVLSRLEVWNKARKDLDDELKGSIKAANGHCSFNEAIDATALLKRTRQDFEIAGTDLHQHLPKCLEILIALQREGAALAIELGRAGIDSTLRRKLSADLMQLQNATSGLRDGYADACAREILAIRARDCFAHIEVSTSLVSKALNQARYELPLRCWKAQVTDSPKSFSEIDRLFVQARKGIDAAQPRLLDLTGRTGSVPLVAVLQKALDDAVADTRVLESLAALVHAVERQSSAVHLMDTARRQLQINLDTLTTICEEALNSPTLPSESRLAQLREASTNLRERSNSFSKKAHDDTPLLMSAERQALLQKLSIDADLAVQDAAVRCHVNAACASIAGKVDFVDERFAMLEQRIAAVSAHAQSPVEVLAEQSEAVVDVFGPLELPRPHSAASKDSHWSRPSSSAEPRASYAKSSPPSSVAAMDKHEELDILDAELNEWLRPANAVVTELPSEQVSHGLQTRLRSIEGALRSLERLDRVEAVEKLAQVDTYAKMADEAFSALLNAIDGFSDPFSGALRRTSSSRSLDGAQKLTMPTRVDPEKIEAASQAAREALKRADMAAAEVDIDPRVELRMLQLRQTFAELCDLAEDERIERLGNSESIERLADSPTAQARLKKSVSEAILSTRDYKSSRQRQQSEGHGRSVSVTVATRIPSRPSSQASSRGPSRPTSRAAQRPSTSLPKSTSRQSIGQGRPKTVASSNKVTHSRAPSLATANRPGAKYRPDTKRQIDVEVSKIVNALPIVIPIRAQADKAGGTTGSYWIGAPEAKLYYCRILRSQTVMVRVGGGWNELSLFLRKNFAHLFTLPQSASAHSITAEAVRASVLEQADSVTSPSMRRAASATLPSASSSPGLAQNAFLSTPSSSSKQLTTLDASPKRSVGIWR